MIVSKNASSGGTWFFVNPENSKFYKNNADLQQNILMQLMSQRPDGKSNSSTDYISDFFKPMLTYHRYTIPFTRKRFKKLGLTDIDVDKVQAMACIDQIPALQRIGQAIAREQVQEDDFKGFVTA